MSGDITLSARYTPCGNSLELHGTGNFTFGYIGSILDTATGLLYVGNGQYYDPSTGRFLTRGVNPHAPNPYVPWNPIGAILGPLGVIALVFGRRKKRGKWDTLVIIVLIGISAGIGVAACAPAPVTQVPNPKATATPTNTQPANPSPAETPVSEGPGTIITVFPTITPSPTLIVEIGECATASLTPTPISIDAELAQYGVSFIGNMGEWTVGRKEAIRNAVKTIASRFTDVVGGDSVQNFIKVYGYINFEFCDEGCVPYGFGWTAGDHWIKFDGMYSDTTIATRLIVHEMGHLFDRAVCASLNNGKCYDEKGNDLIWGYNTARTDLTGKTGVCLSSTCLGRKGHTEPDGVGYWGFAGGWQVWQFGANDENGDGTNGELWADMFLGWTFNQWGDDTRGINRANYMNERMNYHLKTDFNL